MKLFIKCLKESLQYYFGRNGVVTEAVIAIVIGILIKLALLLALWGFFRTADWLANKIVSFFCIDYFLWYGIVLAGCSVLLFLVIAAIVIFANDIWKRMLIEKEEQIMLIEESDNSKEHEK